MLANVVCTTNPTRSYPVVVTNNKDGSVPLGAALLNLRKRRGLSQRELADRAGLDYGNISRYETGATGFNSDTLQKLLTALDIDLADALENAGSTAEAETLKTANYLREKLEESEIRYDDLFRGSMVLIQKAVKAAHLSREQEAVFWDAFKEGSDGKVWGHDEGNGKTGSRDLG